MLPAIYFEDEPRLGAEKIDDKRPERMLVSEAKSVELLTAQVRPQTDFGHGRSLAELTSATRSHGRSLRLVAWVARRHHRSCVGTPLPSALTRCRPPPQVGRGINRPRW